MAYLRVGGRLADEDGATVVWNVAEGSRGRRWRWVRTGRDGTSVSALLETTPDGRPARLEVASAAGLLVLHPEPDGREAHGNVVGRGGVVPLAFPWGPEHVFDVAGLPWVAGACVSLGGAPIVRPALAVDAALTVRATTCSVETIAGGLPAVGDRWPLE